MPITREFDEFVLLGELDGTGIGFYRLTHYRRPTWPSPEVEKQVHLELGCDDLTESQAQLVALGATVPEAQPTTNDRRILIDPAGHPFCLTQIGPQPW